ncbi:MAG: AAA family ATPase [Nitrosomonadales bacterium]|nr:AAA family ATPase [Nitrosomonadales bacterium]
MRTDPADQADGLRRLLVQARHASSSVSNVSEVRGRTRAITLVAGKHGVGRTCMVINLAAALARSGKDVLVLDENDAPRNVADRLGLYARHDLLDVVRGKCGLGEAVLSASGFSVLSTARARCKPDTASRSRLENALAEVSGGMDVILVDAAMPAGNRYATASDRESGTSLLVVVDATASGITESYALIKRMALEYAHVQFEIVVNKVADEEAAITVFENMARLARRNLAARLEYLGCIPRDDKLMRATQLGRPVVDAFPTGNAAQSYMGLAHRLLTMPGCHDGAENGASTAMRDLLKQAPQSQRRFSREMAHVVN